MGENLVDRKENYIKGPAGKDDSVKTTVVAFHPSLIKALSKADNGEARQNLPFIVEGKDDGSVVSVALSQDPRVLEAIREMRKLMADKGVDR